MKKSIFFSKDLLNVMLVYVDKDTVKFDIDGHEVVLDKWKAESLIQLLIDFDKYSDNILRNVSPTNKNYVQKQLDKLDENYLDYIGYWNDKYYKNGFKDAVNLILLGLAGD